MINANLTAIRSMPVCRVPII